MEMSYGLLCGYNMKMQNFEWHFHGVNQPSDMGMFSAFSGGLNQQLKIWKNAGQVFVH